MAIGDLRFILSRERFNINFFSDYEIEGVSIKKGEGKAVVIHILRNNFLIFFK
jgi:hypothetical protein